MDLALFVNAIRSDAAALATAAKTRLDAPVPSCPGWDVGALVEHVGKVHQWAGRIVREQLDSRPAFDSEPVPRDNIVSWYQAQATALVDSLEATDPNAPVWGFGMPPHVAAFWFRRQAHELSIHRWDAESAVGTAAPISAELAVDSVDELLMILETRVLPRKPDADIGGSLHLHATDAPGEWMIRIAQGKIVVEHGHGKGDAAVRGRASDLALGAWRRRDLPAGPQFERFGSDSVIAAFHALCQF